MGKRRNERDAGGASHDARREARRDDGMAGTLFDALDADGPRAASRHAERPPAPRPVRLRRAPALDSADLVAASQLDIFPDPVEIHDLTPRLPDAARARVRGVYAVRLSRASPTHRVFHDRHGWYCEEHGAECPAVRAAKGRG